MPIFQALRTAGVSWPNTDLSLRFTDAPAEREVLACGTLLSLQHGTTTVAIEVQAAERQLAHGHSTSVLIPSLP
jgi:hypothetical protein